MKGDTVHNYSTIPLKIRFVGNILQTFSCLQWTNQTKVIEIAQHSKVVIPSSTGAMFTQSRVFRETVFPLPLFSIIT